MKVLLVTGLLARENVECYAKQSPQDTTVLSLKVPVAAFLTPKAISEAIKRERLKGFDLILVPGLIRGDVVEISEAVGIPAFKGPQYDADLPVVLDSLGALKLSTTLPADELIRERLRKRALEEIAQIETNREAFLRKPSNFLVGDLAVGKDFPMRVLAEIVDASLLSDGEIGRLAKHYVAQGADLVDVGMIAGESRPDDASRVVAAVKASVNVPVSIDSVDPAEINAAVAAGADLVLSVDAGNVDALAPLPINVAVVAIPTNQQEGIFPRKTEERVQLLEQVIAKVKSRGVKKILGDVILDPLDVSGSICAFREFTERNPEVPLFVGVSNVTELIDADSVGVNALLARLSSEIGAGMLLATQKSSKAQGSVREEAIAAKMMFLAKRHGSVPKDLGIDLLILKDKRNCEQIYDKGIEKNTCLLTGEENPETELDIRGSFRIHVDRVEQNIVAVHFSNASGKPTSIVKAKTAKAVFGKICSSGMVSRLDHAAYLGSELNKAEIALLIGKEYIQDKPLFKP